jgi:hypothetical protein
MARRELIELFLKVAGVVFIAVALARLPGDIEAFASHLDFLQMQGSFGDADAVRIAASATLTPFGIFVTAGLGTIWASRDIVAAAGGDRIQFRTFETILVAIVGVYFMVDGLSDLIRWLIVKISAIIGYDRPWTDFFSWRLGDADMRGVVKLIVGIFVITGRKGIVAARRRVDGWIRVWSRAPE